jgi:hypothetical protein
MLIIKNDLKFRCVTKKAIGKAAKIFFADPSIYSVLGGNIGTQREAFVVAMVNKRA